MSTAVANWPKFLAKLVERREVAERTMAFCFEKPANFKFTPGQFVDITLQNPRETDSEGKTTTGYAEPLPTGNLTRVSSTSTSCWLAYSGLDGSVHLSNSA